MASRRSATPSAQPPGWDLGASGNGTAIITDRDEISYQQLAGRVADAARRLGDGRRLVLIAGANEVDAVVAYLAALTAGHPVLLAPGNNPAAVAALTAAYDPDVVVGRVDGQWRYEERRAGSAHRLHPELALLLSTSGSTGSPKLVRLSYRNLRANAESIATYLDIGPGDRAATTLPMHYCYGLSVINSHLLRGAALILTDRSVADTCFWELFSRAKGTTFAGVPYTFTLLDRIGFDAMRLPHLRAVTQAGGRLAPDRVRHYAELGRRRGWRLFVMYGQTEATARMAYLPPEFATTHPEAIGVPVPGGSLRLEPLDGFAEPDTGELVYSGPNVMLGYAEGPADLARGRTVQELRTGDIARCTAGGLYEIVGRRSRFAKMFGLRIDLQRVEAGLEADGVTACCVARDDELVVAVPAGGGPGDLARRVADRCGVPARSVRVIPVAELPRLPSGKPDYAAVRDVAWPAPGNRPSDLPGSPPVDPPRDGPTDLCALYAEILDRTDVTEDDSFVSLGGDSLSYVELSIRLEDALGRLPAGWHTMPIRDLRPSPTPRRWRALDSTVALRAVSIVAVVGSHIGVFTIRGGAYLLLAVAGFNFSRFHLTTAARRERVRHIATSIARIAVPSAVFIGLALALTGDYGWENVLLLNEAIGPRSGEERYFWFIETLVYIMVAMLVVVAVPIVDRCERRLPFGLPMALLGLALTIRFGVITLSPHDNMTTPARLFWLFALGWAAGKASATWHRWLVAVVAVVAVFDHSDSALREAVVTAGLLLLIWVPHVPAPAVVHRAGGVLAGASLSIYLTHWHVYPVFAGHSGWVALGASLAAGVLYGAAAERVTARLSRLRRHAVTPGIRPPSPRPTSEQLPTKEIIDAVLPVESGTGGDRRRRRADRHRGVRQRRGRYGERARRPDDHRLQWSQRGPGQAAAGALHEAERDRNQGQVRQYRTDGSPARGGG